jgi:cytochrome c5
MTGRILPFALAGGMALLLPAAQAKTPVALKSVAVTLPTSEGALPDGPGMTVVHNDCLTCHSPGMILNQPVMAKAAWAAEVAKMRNVYKAPVPDKDVPTIVDYLTAVKGAK